MIIYIHKPALAISCNLIVFSFFQSLLSDSFLITFGMYDGFNIKGEKEKIHYKINYNKIILTNITLCFSVFNLISPIYCSALRHLASKNVSIELAKALSISLHLQLSISVYYQYILFWYLAILGSNLLLFWEKN